MRKVDDQIKILDEKISKIIDSFSSDKRGFLSQMIIDNLRTLVEVVSVKMVGEDYYSYNIFQSKAKNYITSKSELRFLSKFHKSLQRTSSHYITDEDASERLMLSYYEYLLRMKSLLIYKYNLDILKNLYKFPLDTDNTLNEFHEKISIKIKEGKLGQKLNERFYIQKIKPFFVNKSEIFYEVTFRIADDKARKFDRFIAFTKLEITQNYAVNFFIYEDSIEISNKKMPIYIITDWKTSIRFCEFKNLEKVFEFNVKSYNKTKEYDEIMNFLTKTGLNLVEIIDFPDNYYNKFKDLINSKTITFRIIYLLDRIREFIKNNKRGSNVLRYLLYNLNNRIIKEQYSGNINNILSNLYISIKCIPFDDMPFATFPVGHTPFLSDVLDCIDPINREHELFARYIMNNSETKGCLYTPKEEVVQFGNIEEYINTFNNLLYQGTEAQRSRGLDIYKDHVYITGYEKDVIEIINKLKDLSSDSIKNYSNSINSWLISPENKIDCEQKKTALQNMFKSSKVSIVYGSAGTGKTKLIEFISKYHNERSKLYLANTHSAVSNLKSRIIAQNSEFKTIKSFLSDNNQNVVYDVLIIDECSVISNLDMRNLLRKAKFGVLILVGDVFQIESIRFGNWFYIAKNFIPKSAVTELTTPWRARDNKDLLDLWDKVRNIKEDMIDHITQNKYSCRLDETIFKKENEDEIILCLNYDGFYGINNINRFLQENNNNQPILWEFHTYKINDPILFNESGRFGSSIHNNLKGKIIDIKQFDDSIQFDIQIDKSISELDIMGYDLDLLDSIEKNKSIIRFKVNRLKNTDEDDDEDASDIVPFQVAYAVSIHKAQGLEYDSVKIVITNEIEEKISHNIFYTAITRTKNKLKIYWTPETENKILGSLEHKFNKRDVYLLKSKYNI